VTSSALTRAASASLARLARPEVGLDLLGDLLDLALPRRHHLAEARAQLRPAVRREEEAAELAEERLLRAAEEARGQLVDERVPEVAVEGRDEGRRAVDDGLEELPLRGAASLIEVGRR